MFLKSIIDISKMFRLAVVCLHSRTTQCVQRWSILYFSGVPAYDEATTEVSYYQETAVQL